MQTAFVGRCRVGVVESRQAFVGTEVERAVVSALGRIPIELRRQQTVFLMIIGEDGGAGVKVRQAMHSGYPKHAVLAFGNAAHGVVAQSVAHAEGGERRPAFLHTGALIESVAVAAQPKRTVTGLAEAGNLINDTVVGVVQQVFIVLIAERAACQVDVDGSLQAAHPKVAVGKDDATNAPSEVATAGERVVHHTFREVVTEDAVVAANPDGLVDGVVL